jgi:hypothetical protein
VLPKIAVRPAWNSSSVSQGYLSSCEYTSSDDDVGLAAMMRVGPRLNRGVTEDNSRTGSQFKHQKRREVVEGVGIELDLAMLMFGLPRGAQRPRNMDSLAADRHLRPPDHDLAYLRVEWRPRLEGEGARGTNCVAFPSRHLRSVPPTTTLNQPQHQIAFTSSLLPLPLPPSDILLVIISPSPSYFSHPAPSPPLHLPFPIVWFLHPHHCHV